MDQGDPTAAHVRALVPDRRLIARRVPLETLHQDPANARAHGAENLEAIEANAFDRLPSATFVKGYVKQVVEQLELNEPELVDEFMEAYRRQRGRATPFTRWRLP